MSGADGLHAPGSETESQTTQDEGLETAFAEVKKKTRKTTRKRSTAASTSTEPTQPTNITSTSIKPTNNNFQTFNENYTIFTSNTVTRIELAGLWISANKDTKDIVIKNKDNFTLKTNNENASALLDKLIQEGKIIKYVQHNKKSASNQPPSTSKSFSSPSYSVVVNGVEEEIQDQTFLQHLQDLQLKVRFCKRIISRERQKPTLLLRLITGDLPTYEKLISGKGIYFMGRIYNVSESKPPKPIPVPCSRCSSFDHTTEKCITPPKCSKCLGPHSTNNCKSPLPPKCLACNEEGHAAWSTKCPKRPTKPIAGLPNIKIRCTNKSSTELPPQTTQNNRIHEKMTTHDYIINKYKHNLNKEENVNREEIIRKLRRRFVQDFSIDTSVVFFGNSMYILMFDLLNPERTSPTEPKDHISQTVTNITQHD